ncbi:MAG: AMP-binding protein [Actinomycetota bacterium]|nr:AMP-binding protein [Actinomycetota bacterium]
MLSHGNLTWNAVNFLVTGDFRPDDVSLAIAPFFRVGGLGVTLLETFLVGGSVVLMPTFESGRALELIERYGFTVLFGGPDLLQALQDHPSFPRTDMSSVRICYTGGAPVPEHLIRSYLERGVPILQGYGLSEAAPLALLLDAEDMTRKIGSAGKPPFFTDVRIVRPDLTDVAPGEVGEVLVSGPNVMKGYWNRPDATAETIVAGHWLRMGDAARSDDEGYIYMVGRMADAYMADGRLVFPDDIERILVDHPAVRDVAVVGVTDETLGETGVALVVAVSDAETSEDDLLEWTAAYLDRPDTLREVRFTDAIPRNPAGKVLRHALRRLAESEAPRD